MNAANAARMNFSCELRFAGESFTVVHARDQPGPRGSRRLDNEIQRGASISRNAPFLFSPLIFPRAKRWPADHFSAGSITMNCSCAGQIGW